MNKKTSIILLALGALVGYFSLKNRKKTGRESIKNFTQITKPTYDDRNEFDI